MATKPKAPSKALAKPKPKPLPPDLSALVADRDRAAARVTAAEESAAAHAHQAQDPRGGPQDRVNAQDAAGRILDARADLAQAQGHLDMAIERRKRNLSSIHIGAKALGLDPDTYAQQIHRLTAERTDSAGLMTDRERQALLAEYAAAGWRPTPPRLRQVRQPEPRKDLAGWIRAMLLDAGRTDAYADAIARKSYKVDMWEWLPWHQMLGLGQMLQIDARKSARNPRAKSPAERGKHG